MNKPLLIGAFMALGLYAGAEVVSPRSFSVNFGESGIPSGWIMSGADAAPAGQFASYFEGYSATNAFTTLIAQTAQGALTAACTPQQFVGDVLSDQWLITPEFEVDSDMELLTFTVVAGGNNVKNLFDVYISETGSSKEDFTASKDNLLLGTALVGKNDMINSVSRRIVLDKYKGKKVHLAFVSAGNQSGILGFSDISVAPYYLNVENADVLEQPILDSANPNLTFRIKVSTPVKTAGLTAVLKCSNGYEATYEYTGNLTPNMFTTIVPEFNDIDFKGESQTDYTIEIKPNMEGVVPSVISGTLMNASRIYRPVLVGEDLTGTWCGNCPYGIAYMNYYSDKYNGENGKPRFIPIALHDNDPMQVPAEYIDNATATSMKYMTSFGYPTINLNRATADHPLNVPVDAYAELKAFASVYMSRVDYDKDTREISVNYHPRLSFSASKANMRVAVAVLENGVKGVGDPWSQSNYLAQFTKEQVAQQLGEDLVPYFEPFVEQKGQYIPASSMVYNDVARGIYPSYQGALLEGEWVADTYCDHVMTLKAPATVSDPDNMAVVLMLLNGGSGEIVAADMIEAADFGKEFSGVAPVLAADGGVTLYAADGKAVVEAEAAGEALVYSMDGRLIKNDSVAAGHNEILLPEGMVIVKVNTPSGSAVIKTINR